MCSIEFSVIAHGITLKLLLEILLFIFLLVELDDFHSKTDYFNCFYFHKDTGSLNGAQQQIYKMLAEVLGGINCVKASVLTPYYHTIGKFLIINWNFKKKGFLKNFFSNYLENFQRHRSRKQQRSSYDPAFCYSSKKIFLFLFIYF